MITEFDNNDILKLKSDIEAAYNYSQNGSVYHTELALIMIINSIDFSLNTGAYYGANRFDSEGNLIDITAVEYSIFKSDDEVINNE